MRSSSQNGSSEPNYKEVDVGVGRGRTVFFPNVAVLKDKEIAAEMLRMKGGQTDMTVRLDSRLGLTLEKEKYAFRNITGSTDKIRA